MLGEVGDVNDLLGPSELGEWAARIVEGRKFRSTLQPTGIGERNTLQPSIRKK